MGVGILLKIDNSILQFHQNQDRKSTKCFAIFIIVSQMYIFVFNLFRKFGDKYEKITYLASFVARTMEGHSNCVEKVKVSYEFLSIRNHSSKFKKQNLYLTFCC